MGIHRIYFSARNWELNRKCPNNVGERCFISGIDGKLEEVYYLDATKNARSEIISKPMMLERNSLYRFSFWVKGGENLAGDEVCQLHVVFDGKNEQAYQYKLNGNHIFPVKEVQEWRLYEISFATYDTHVTQLKFIVERADLTVMPAADPVEYKNLIDDRTVSGRNKLSHKEIVATDLYQQILKRLDTGYMEQQIVNDIVEQLAEKVKQDIDLESLVKDFSNSMDTEQIQNEIRNLIKEHIEKEKEKEKKKITDEIVDKEALPPQD